MDLTSLRALVVAALMAVPTVLVVPSAQAHEHQRPVVRDNCQSSTAWCSFTATGPSGFVLDERFPRLFPEVYVHRPDGSGWWCRGYYNGPSLFLPYLLWDMPNWNYEPGMHAGVGSIGAGDMVTTYGLRAGRDYPFRLPEATPRTPVPSGWNSGCWEYGPDGKTRWTGEVD